MSCPGNISGFLSWCLGSAENHWSFSVRLPGPRVDRKNVWKQIHDFVRVLFVCLFVSLFLSFFLSLFVCLFVCVCVCLCHVCRLPLFHIVLILCKGKLRAFYRQVSSTDSSFPSALAIYNKRVSFPKKETQSEIQQTKTDQHIYIYTIYMGGHPPQQGVCVCFSVF